MELFNYETLGTVGECIVTKLDNGSVEKVFFYDATGFPCRRELAFRAHIQVLDELENLVSEEIGFIQRVE